MSGAARAKAMASSMRAGVPCWPAARPMMAPFCAPRLRSRRVSWRVSTLAMATVCPRTRYCASVAVARKLLASGVDLVGFDVLLIDAAVADVRVRECHDLLAVARVGEDFLVAGDGGVEHHFCDRGAGGTNRMADEDRAVCERQDGGRETSL